MSDSYKVYASQDYVDNKKTSWNELEDKPFGEDKTEVFIIPETTFVTQNIMGQSGRGNISNPNNYQIEPNTFYTVVYDGVTHELMSYTDEASGISCLLIGESFEEPELLIAAVTNVSFLIDTGVTKDGVQHTLSVSTVKEVVTQLDPKFIPDNVALDEELHAVAKSGSYNDLADVPTDVSVFTNDAGYLTEHQDISAYALKTELPTTLDDLHPATTADAGKIIMVQSDGKWSVQALETEQWTFTLDDGTEVVKNVVVL